MKNVITIGGALCVCCNNRFVRISVNNRIPVMADTLVVNETFLGSDLLLGSQHNQGPLHNQKQ